MSPFGPFRRLGPTDRFALRMAALCTVLIIACGGLTFGYLGQRHANRATEVAGQASDAASKANQAAADASRAAADATRAIAGSCQFYHDIASIPIVPTSTKALLTIIADARGGYDTADCQRTHGPLPPMDPRVTPYLSHSPPASAQPAPTSTNGHDR